MTPLSQTRVGFHHDVVTPFAHGPASSLDATGDAHPLWGLLVAFAGLLLATCQFLKREIKDSETRLREEMKASEARQREEMKASETRLREEMKAGEARQREALLEVKGELKSLGDKLDRVFEGRLASRS